MIGSISRQPLPFLRTQKPIDDPAHYAPGFCCAFAASGKSEGKIVSAPHAAFSGTRSS